MFCHPLLILVVALPVSPELGHPKTPVAFRQVGDSTPGMGMPETAMDKNDSPVFRENQVRAAFQLAVIKPVAETTGKDQLAEENLKLGIFGREQGHVRHMLTTTNATT